MHIRLVFVFIAMVVSFSSSAAPIPATSSSLIIAPEKGQFISPKGFILNAGDSKWVQSEAPKGIRSVATVYKGPVTTKGIQAALTVRVDDLQRDSSLKSYIRKWSKDYPRFGFDILASKPIKVNEEVGYLLDLVNKETEKQLRQVVFLKDRRAVILTCRDHMNSFLNNLKGCNEIIRSFRWSAADSSL